MEGMDGDAATDGADEGGTIEGWRQECERLRGQIGRLTNECNRLHGQIGRLTNECNRLRQENGRLEASPAASVEAGTIDEWRRAYQLLQGRVTQLETQLKAGRQCIAERDKEIERLKADSTEPGLVENLRLERDEFARRYDGAAEVISHLVQLL